MHAFALLTLGAASLAAAAPSTKKDSFAVSNFVFGCTAGCYYNFDVSFKDSEAHCAGSLEDKDYVKCEGADGVSAYIDTSADKNDLKLQAEVSNVAAGSRYNYYGDKQVYAATSSDADKQKESFKVQVKKTTGVA